MAASNCDQAWQEGGGDEGGGGELKLEAQSTRGQRGGGE